MTDQPKPANKAPARKTPARKAREKRASAADTAPYGLKALKAASLATLAAIVLTLAALYLLGHAASWRSIGTLLVQSLPLLPAFLLGFVLVGWLERRFNLPSAITLALILLGTIGIMLAAPAITFTVYTRFFVGGADEFMFTYTFRQTLWAFVSGMGLYLATGAWLWWPIGLALPPLAAFLYWKYVRRH